MRTDAHRPSVINPADYEWVAWEIIEGYFDGDQSALWIMQEERRRITDHMRATGGHYSMHDHGGNCGVCGSVNAIYTVLFWHRPSNTYVRMGQDCAMKCEVAFNDGDFNAFKTKCKNALDLIKGKRKAEAILKNAGFDEAPWDMYINGDKYENCYETRTICDVINSIVKYGNILERQVNYVKNLLHKYLNRDAILRQREAEKEMAKPVPITDSRIEINGEIIKIAPSEGIYGGLKMTIKTACGWIAWGSVPRSNIDLQRGMRVKFVASITPSEKDCKFGFFKRPKNIQLA
jgi:hypothetical protein